MGYFSDISDGIRTTLTGLKITFRHIRQATHRRANVGIAADNYFEQQTGLVTLQYPHEKLPIPDNGRYRLHNEMDDCIVCDKCAKICPVDCITIDPIKATGEVGRASDGSPIRLYAAKFDIDMAKCCYCGLCTMVCPTECLTMEKKFDYSEFELGKLTYNFANLTPEQADEKRTLYEQFVREKDELKAQQAAAKAVAQPTTTAAQPAGPPKRPLFKPSLPKSIPPADTPVPEPAQNSTDGAIAHPLTDATPDEAERIATGTVAERSDSNLVDNTLPETPVKPTPPRPAFRPSMKPPTPAPEEPIPNEAPPTAAEAEIPAPAKKPAFRPTMKPPVTKPIVTEEAAESAPTPPAPTSAPTETPVAETPPPAKKPAFRPTMKPTKPPTTSGEPSQLE